MCVCVCISKSLNEFIAERVRETVMNGVDWQNSVVYCLGVMHICVCVCERERIASPALDEL